MIARSSVSAGRGPYLLSALFLLSAFLGAGCQSPTIVVLEDPRTYIEERSILVAREDARIRLDIQAEYLDHKVGRLKNVTVEVYEGAVLLTGTVADQDAWNLAGSLAASIEGAAPVYNELQTVPEGSLRDAAADLTIETRIKKDLREAKGVRSANMRWRCVNGTVYMFGRALSADERDLALTIVGAVPGVKDIVDHMKVGPRDD